MIRALLAAALALGGGIPGGNHFEWPVTEKTGHIADEGLRFTDGLAENIGRSNSHLTPDREHPSGLVLVDLIIRKPVVEQDCGAWFRCPGRHLNAVPRGYWRLEFGPAEVRITEVDMANSRKALDVDGGRLAAVTDFESDDRMKHIKFDRHALNGEVATNLRLTGFASNSVGLEGEIDGNEDKQAADPAYPSLPRCPPGRVSGCIRRFPLGAQIGISLIIAGIALAVYWRAFRPFGLLVISRRDVFQSAGAALLGTGLLWISLRIWMLGG